ncbi:MAG: FAD-dependent oxidoreductase [bacterium]|nr:FAD-dependent oxidoreductase [bacterium]
MNSNAEQSTPQNSQPARVLILGGGYAGLSAAILLGREKDAFDVTLIDASDSYLSSIQLHRTVHTPLSKLRIDYQSLSSRYNFRFRQERLDFDRSMLPLWVDAGSMPTTDGRIEFDYLCLCTGAGSIPIENDTEPALIGARVFTLDYLKENSFDKILAEALAHRPGDEAGDVRPMPISIVGGGATGIQFLFELDDHLKKTGRPYLLRLVDLEKKIMASLSSGFHGYVARRMRERKIEYYPGLRFRRQEDSVLIGENTADDSEVRLDSDMTLLFPGISARPFAMRANRHGQLEVAGNVLSNVLAAGDCVHYDAPGMNAPAAQAAVRKGRLIAENIKRLQSGEKLQSYTYPELGYFLSLGPWDGIGWMLVRFNVLTGIAAFGIKEAIELQFRLFLEGVDTYIDL